MRTTVNVDDNLLDATKARAQETGRTLGDVIEHALQLYLSSPPPDFTDAPELPVFVGGEFAAGVDPTSNASMLDAVDEGGSTA